MLTRCAYLNTNLLTPLASTP